MEVGSRSSPESCSFIFVNSLLDANQHTLHEVTHTQQLQGPIDSGPIDSGHWRVDDAQSHLSSLLMAGHF